MMQYFGQQMSKVMKNVSRTSESSSRISKKIILFTITCSVFFLSTFPVFGTLSTKKMNPLQEEPEPEEIAHTRVNLTLTDSDTIYQRETGVPNIEPLFGLHRYTAIAKLTTHADILIQIAYEFYSDSDLEWNEDFELFKNSTQVKEFRNYDALQRLVAPVNISLLEITSHSFSMWEDNRSATERIFGIEQHVIFRQTTAFLLALPEPFNFGLNKLELGQISDLHFLSEYEDNREFGEQWVFESIRLKAPGSPIEYISNVKGYSGIIYLTENFWDVTPIPRYERPFVSAPQNIFFQVKLPTGQSEINYDFDSKYKSNVSETDRLVTSHRNRIEFAFPLDSYLPYSISINSQTPFLEQFTITDYVGMLFGALAALVTVVKAIPYFLSRRSFSKFKKGLHNAAEKENVTEFETLQEKALDKYMRRKISTSQFEEVRKDVQILKRYMSTAKSKALEKVVEG
ncbi:MAG: hypothetical protein JSV04_03730 [Candidatus Heimdallarchaeota archaeon]|nr:MAG: hypothetical protein JSV04_03730 [Candidatus Heimdallarchaeota archaeon]